MQILVKILILLLIISCKPQATSTLQEDPYSSLASAWNTVNNLRSKRNSGQHLSYSELVQLMNIVASKSIIQASERQRLYQLLQEMRIPNIAHSTQTYLLGKEFGEHAVDRKETVFDVAKDLLLDAVVNNPSSDVKRAFEENLAKLPPNAELQSVYSLIPRVVSQRERVFPKAMWRPQNLTAPEYIGILRWYVTLPTGVQKALSDADSETFIKLGLTLSGKEREQARKDFSDVYMMTEAMQMEKTDIGNFLSPAARKIDSLAEQKFGRGEVGTSAFDAIGFAWNGLNETQKSKINSHAMELRDPHQTLRVLMQEARRNNVAKRALNDIQAALDVNLDWDGKSEPSRYSAALHYGVAVAVDEKEEVDYRAYRDAQTAQTSLYFYLQLDRDQNRQAIADRILADWRDRNRTAPEQVLGVVAGFLQSGKALVWDLPKGAVYKPLVEGDTSFYQAIGYVASNPDVLASVLVNQIDDLDKNLPEKTGGLAFDIALTLLTAPAAGSGGVSFRALEKMDSFDLEKARHVTARLERLAEKASTKLINSNGLNADLRRKAQQLSDLAGQAKTKLQKLEIDHAVKSLDEMAETVSRQGNGGLADELRALSTKLRGGAVADAPDPQFLAKLRAKYGGRLPDQTEDLLEQAVTTCKALSLTAQPFACTIPGPNGKKISSHEDAIVYNGFFSRKMAREIELSFKMGEYDKHLKVVETMTAEELAKLSKVESQYLFKFKQNHLHFKLEKKALAEGVITRDGATRHALFRFEEIVGYADGNPTHWIRAEFSSGNIVHGHPRDFSLVKQAIAGNDLLKMEMAMKFGHLLTDNEITDLALRRFINQLNQQ